MDIRSELAQLVDGVNGTGPGPRLVLPDEDLARLEGLVAEHPEAWPVPLAETLALLRRRLAWDPVDREKVPAYLLDFFDGTFRRLLDPLALARSIGGDLCSACGEGACRC